MIPSGLGVYALGSFVGFLYTGNYADGAYDPEPDAPSRISLLSTEEVESSLEECAQTSPFHSSSLVDGCTYIDVLLESFEQAAEIYWLAVLFKVPAAKLLALERLSHSVQDLLTIVQCEGDSGYDTYSCIASTCGKLLDKLAPWDDNIYPFVRQMLNHCYQHQRGFLMETVPIMQSHEHLAGIVMKVWLGVEDSKPQGEQNHNGESGSSRGHDKNQRGVKKEEGE